LVSRAADAARLGVTLGAQLAGGALGVVRATAESLVDSVERAARLGGEPHPYERAARASRAASGGVRSATVRFERSGSLDEDLEAPYDEALARDVEVEAAEEAVDDEWIGAPDAYGLEEGPVDDELEQEALADERAGALEADEAEGAEIDHEAVEREGGAAGGAGAVGADEAEAGPDLDAAREPLASRPDELAARRDPGGQEDAALAERPSAAPPDAAAPRGPASPEEDHVDTGAALVGEFAEAGAEEGAGAEVEVAEPWDGYARMTAAEVRRRLTDAAPATLTAVALYERVHRGRKSVLEDAERRIARGAAHP
jgi:hypothetical protein